MFEAMNHQKEIQQCYHVDLMDEVVKEVNSADEMASPMGRVILNSVEQVEDEYDMEVVECLL